MNHGNSEPPCKRRKYLSTEMSTNVTLGVWSSERFQRITVENVDLEGKVEVFRSQALKALPENSSRDIELSYCGIILDNKNTLTSYGVGPGVTIHILERPKPRLPSNERAMTGDSIVSAFKNLTSSNEYRTVFQRLTRREVVDKIVEAVPDLEEDPALLALIQDPELLMYLSHAETVQKLAEEHPLILRAAEHIISHIPEAQTNVNPNHASTSTGYSYSLEALSDDDDMDSSSEGASQYPLTRNTSFNAITAAQLAAAIAQATNTQFNTNSAGMPSSAPTSSNVITTEMFSTAIQQAFGNSGGNNGGGSGAMFSSPGAAQSEEDSIENLTVRWQVQLQQMHEMGLINDSVNVRALRATNGNVSAAIELVLSLNSEI